jgi:cephalosporin-C deacetylase-like acetyl esterase
VLRLEQQAEDHALAARLIGATRRKRYTVEKVEFLSEPGIYIPAWIFLPERVSSQRAILYVSESGKENDGMEFGIVEHLARQGRIVVSIDVRGVGDTTPPHAQDLDAGKYSHLFSVETAAAYMAWYMNRCLFGMRVHDVLRSIDYVLSRPDLDRTGVDAIGRGAGALWILYAAALDARIRAVVAERGLVSYASLTKVDRYLHTAGVFIRDVLTRFDLPHVAATLAGRRLGLVAPADPMKESVETAAVEREYAFTRAVYARAGARDRFVIAQPEAELNPGDQFLRLLG